MKTNTLLSAAVLVMHGLITACSGTSGGKTAEISGPNVFGQTLTEADLANAGYRLDSLGEFRLDKGVFVRRDGEGETQRHKVTLEKAAFGDLDHDGLGDAAVILAWQSGGSGTFKYLVAMKNTGIAPRQQDSVLLGDRLRSTALSIAGGEVVLEMLSSGPHDPACCPSLPVRHVYRLSDGKWAKSADSKAVGDTSAEITGIVWKWERYEDTLEPRHIVIDDPNKYTLILLPDGNYRVKADCNLMQGRYTLEGRNIKIVPGPATLAECGPESRYLEYLKDLTSAVHIGLRDGKLVLNLVMGGEILVFGNGGPVSKKP
ncbi:MAG: META domain-containing protein [Gammaproteobacteria bacterium]